MHPLLTQTHHLLRILPAAALVAVAVLGGLAANPTPVSAADPIVRDRISLKDLQIADTTYKGQIPTAELFFPSTGDQALTEGSFVELVFGHSESLRNPSSMTVAMNGLPLKSVFLDSSNVSQSLLRVEVPLRALQPDFNRLQVTFYLITQLQNCALEDPAAYAIIFNDTAINYKLASGATSTTPFVPNLALWPRPFLRQNFPVESNPAIVIPNGATSTELSAGASIIGHLERIARGTTFVPLLGTPATVTTTQLADRHAIVIGNAGRNPYVAQVLANSPVRVNPDGSLRTADGQPIDPTHGVIVETPSPWRNTRASLVITSQTDEGLQKATVALANLKSAALVSGAFTIVSEVSTKVGLGDDGNNQTTSVQFPFSQDQTVRGFGTTNIAIPFFAPNLGNEGSALLEMFFTYSTAMDRRSNLVVEINSTPVLTVPLTPDGSGRVESRITLPRASFNPGRNSISFRFTLYQIAEDCGPLAAERGWAVISPTTRINFSGGSTAPTPDQKPDLKYWPFPYVTLGSVDNSLVVLPDGNSALALLPSIAKQIGTVVLTDGLWLAVAEEAQFTQAERNSDNVLAVVRPTSPLIQQELAPYLPLQIDPNGSIRLVQGQGNPIFDVNRGGSFGILQVIVSPWNPARWILLVTGSDDPGAVKALDALSGPLPSGNVATVSLSGNIASLTTTPFVRGTDETTRAAQFLLYITLGIAAVTVLLVGLILVRWSRGDYAIDGPRDSDL